MSTTSRLYALPDLYDAFQRRYVDGAVGALERVVENSRREHERPESSPEVWLEVACGSGLLTWPCVRPSRRVVGFDASAEMIEAARARKDVRIPPGGRAPAFVVADMTRFAGQLAGRDAGHVDVAFNLVNSIRHLTEPDALARHLEEVSDVLVRDGIYVVGLHLHSADTEIEEDCESVELDGERVTRTTQFLPPEGDDDRTETVIAQVTLESTGGAVRSFSDRYSLRTYTPEQWSSEIEASKFEIRGVYDLHGDSTEIGPGYRHFALAPHRRPRPLTPVDPDDL